MKPTDTLRHEHQVIEMVLDAAQDEIERMSHTGKVDPDRLRQFVEFFRFFADRCHHAKEEEYLFERLKERGLPADQGPIGVMLYEHEEGRKHIRGLEDGIENAAAGQEPAVRAVREHLQDFVDLLRSHISKENNILFVMADQLLTDRDQRELEEAFERVEAQEIGPDVHERYHQLAHQLAGR